MCVRAYAHMQSSTQLSYSYIQAYEPLLTFCTLTSHFWFGNTVSAWLGPGTLTGQTHIQERYSLVGSDGSVSPPAASWKLSVFIAYI